MNEDDCLVVSSRGIAKSCDIRCNNLISSSSTLPELNKAFENCTIYICNTGIKDFSLRINEIKNRFILVSGDSDEEIFKDIFSNETECLDFISNDNIIHWFCQNCTYKHPKITNLPIGLDYHTYAKTSSPDEQEKIVVDVHSQSEPFDHRIRKCYINFQYPPEFYRYSFDRIEALNDIPQHLCFKEKEKQLRDICWKNQSKYSFVISPFGNGLDCHRTWEALVLGCIPIVRSSGMNHLFDDLPVLIVNSWKDINDELLENTITLFKEKTINYDKLTLSYWVSKFDTYKINEREGFSIMNHNDTRTTEFFVILFVFVFILLFFILNYTKYMLQYKKYKIVFLGIGFLFVTVLFFQYYKTPFLMEYFDKTKIPTKEMKQYNVIFCGTVRDCEKYIGNTLDNIEKCGKKFKSFAVIIYENDSKDATRKILEEKKKDNYFYLFEDNVAESRRTMRLANGRNKIVDKARYLSENGDFDYLIILDMDNVNETGKFVESIESCFEYDAGEWDVLTGNQTGRYYDMWALRKENDYNIDFVADPNGMPSRMYEKNGLLEINSAFGGIAIYKLSAIPKKCKYIGEYKENNEFNIQPYSEKCEHVEFNECIKENNGKLFLNTEFVTY